MKKRLFRQRALAVALSICLLASSMDFTVLAAETGCNHVHDENCGYREAVAGQPCNKGGLTVSGGDSGHVHDESCGYREAVEAKPCKWGVTISVSGGDAVAIHDHDGSCGYIEAEAGQECTCGAALDVTEENAEITHAEDCEYRKAVEGHPCTYENHTAHNEECGYREAVEGQPCEFVPHMQHDDECGYAAEVTALPCRHAHNASCGGLEPVEVSVGGRTYITNADQIMAYMQKSALNTDIIGQYGGQWIQTTYNLTGYQAATRNMTDASVIQDADFVNGGRYVRLRYTVTAGDTAVTDGMLAVHSDVQIGADDKATIKVIKDSSGSRVIGLSMIGVKSTQSVANSDLGTGIGAQYNLYFRGTNGVTDVSTYWFGYYSDRRNNCYNQLQSNAKELTDASKNGYDDTAESYSNRDSGLAVSWHNINLEPGESKTYSIIIGVGEAAEPPKWGGDEETPTIRLSLDAELPDRHTVNVEANIKDQAGVIDSIYYTVDDGSENKLLDSVATGEDQTVKGVIHLPDLNPSTRHKILLWITNSKGAVSEAVEKWIEVDETGKIQINDHTHEYEIVEEKEPTCIEEGHVIKGCRICNGQEAAYSPALGHEFGDYVYNNDATYEHDGTETATCVRGCKDTRIKPGTRLIPKEDKVIEGDITGKDTYESVTAKLVGIDGMKGREYPADVTGSSSPYHYRVSAPPDEYNLVVNARKKDGTELTVTSLVELTEDITDKDIVLPMGEKNSRVVLVGSARTVLVGELDNIADASGAEEDTVNVVFTVDERTEQTADGAEQIKRISQDRILEYLDFKLTRQVNNDPAADIGDENTKLLPVIVPFENADKENLAVYRYHEDKTRQKGEAEQLTETPNENGEYIEFSEDSVMIHAMKFSTYAIGYTLPKAEPPKEDPPKVEPPKEDPPKAELPKEEPPKVEEDDDDEVFVHSQIVTPKASEPKTGVSQNAVPWATMGMIAGFTYLLDLFAEKAPISLGMTEEQKNRVISWIVKRAKHKNRFVRYLAIGAIFMILLFYHLIGKHLAVKEELKELRLGAL
ncbi:MAG: hypothetical protein NC251_12860 [Lachnoclostridium sp.]|nr:hypothetical protein [Lachnospira sp.]MCM1249305.1 hypothetical protein [Lachnoclostridium sp.]